MTRAVLERRARGRISREGEALVREFLGDQGVAGAAADLGEAMPALAELVASARSRLFPASAGAFARLAAEWPRLAGPLARLARPVRLAPDGALECEALNATAGYVLRGSALAPLAAACRSAAPEVKSVRIVAKGR